MKRKHTTHIQRSDTHAAALRAPDSAVRGILNRLFQAAPAPLDCGGFLSFCVGAAWLLDTAKGLLKQPKPEFLTLQAECKALAAVCVDRFEAAGQTDAEGASYSYKTSHPAWAALDTQWVEELNALRPPTRTTDAEKPIAFHNKYVRVLGSRLEVWLCPRRISALRARPLRSSAVQLSMAKTRTPTIRAMRAGRHGLFVWKSLRGGAHLEVGSLHGLPLFVKKLRVAGSDWDAYVLAANAKGRPTRVPVRPGTGPWRWEAVGFEEEQDLGLALLAHDMLDITSPTVFRVDADGVGQRIKSTTLAVGQSYRLLLPPNLADDVGTDCGDGWRVWSLSVAADATTTTRQALTRLGLSIGEACPRLDWALTKLAVKAVEAHVAGSGRLPTVTAPNGPLALAPVL